MLVTKHRLGWPGNRKNVPGVACSVNEAVVHLSHWFFMVNAPINVKPLGGRPGKGGWSDVTVRFRSPLPRGFPELSIPPPPLREFPVCHPSGVCVFSGITHSGFGVFKGCPYVCTAIHICMQHAYDECSFNKAAKLLSSLAGSYLNSNNNSNNK